MPESPIRGLLDATEDWTDSKVAIRTKYLTGKDKYLALKRIEYASIRGGDLRPWMKKLAEWSGTEEKEPSFKAYCQVATQLAGVKLAAPMVRHLIWREDWREYRKTFASDLIGKARRKVEQRVGEYVDTHYEALKASRQNIASDPKTAAGIAEPILDRVWPKKEELAAAQTTVIVNLAPTQKMETVLEYEILPCEVVESTKELTP